MIGFRFDFDLVWVSAPMNTSRCSFAKSQTGVFEHMLAKRWSIIARLAEHLKTQPYDQVHRIKALRGDTSATHDPSLSVETRAMNAPAW